MKCRGRERPKAGPDARVSAIQDQDPEFGGFVWTGWVSVRFSKNSERFPTVPRQSGERIAC